jgi:hypothetical protein
MSTVPRRQRPVFKTRVGANFSVGVKICLKNWPLGGELIIVLTNIGKNVGQFGPKYFS